MKKTLDSYTGSLVHLGMINEETIMNLNETIYNGSFLLGKDFYVDGKHRVKDISFRDYLHEINLIYGPELEDVVNIAVVWEVIDEDQYVKQIYNHDTGEIYFDEAEEMTDEVDDFISSILMYGNLEQTIG
tara:strand:+ start:156 stop:545 length:390 start_codon:yes stop_codon:yes gene_type:complete